MIKDRSISIYDVAKASKMHHLDVYTALEALGVLVWGRRCFVFAPKYRCKRYGYVAKSGIPQLHLYYYHLYYTPEGLKFVVQALKQSPNGRRTDNLFQNTGEVEPQRQINIQKSVETHQAIS